jgi:hypothetical protein
MRWVQQVAGAWIALLALGILQGAEPGRLSIAMPDTGGWPRLTLEGLSNEVVRIEASPDFVVWREIGRGHARLLNFPDPTAAPDAPRFYRGIQQSRTSADDWKNQVFYPDDPLRSPDPGHGRLDPRWIKFAIVLDDPHRVCFQDSVRYLFHYDFAVARLDPVLGMSRAEFDAVSLYRENQRVVLGAVLFARSPNLREMAVQIVGRDPYPVEQVADWIDLVRSVVVAPGEVEVLYFPTFEQAAITQSNLAFFQARGIAVGSASRWVWTDECYAAGWTLGRLVFVPAADLAQAYHDGRLRPDDILLIDAVPAAVPPVAGIVTLTPATPNSHAAILAQSLGIPFVYFADAAAREQLLSWDGAEVLLRGHVDFWGIEVKTVNLEGQLEPGIRAALRALKAPPQLTIPPTSYYGLISQQADLLEPADTRYVGGKAAHFGLLRRSIPDHSPSPAIAFTFDLWEEFLSQPMPGGETLRAIIDAKLSGFAWPPDMAQLQDTLAEVRDLIRNEADFAPALRAEILGVLLDAGFDMFRRIRFRSSSNVEDSEQFSGAGLYDSYSGCLGDELLPDDGGPSWCNPEQPRKRGVFRALRRVYASFYNDNAFLERLRHGLDESQVGMGVLAHYSYPDEIELANGVATFEIELIGVVPQRRVNATIVTQLGAVSVTNPEGNAMPEVLHASRWGGGAPWLDLRRHSSLVPLGGTVLEWDAEYYELFRLLDDAARAYEAYFPDKRRLALDFEFKKELVGTDGILSVKQIREIPRPPTPGLDAPWLLNETNRYAVFQGEFGELFAYHRLKSFWTLQTANLQLEPDGSTDTFYRNLNVELFLGLNQTNVTSDIRAWPGFFHRREQDTFIDGWTWGDGATGRSMELRTWLPIASNQTPSPVLFLSDGRIEWVVTHATPQLALDFTGPTLTTTDRVTLMPIDPVGPLSLRQTRSFGADGIAVETTFYWPAAPTGVVAGYTAPLQGWVETTITGLIPQPIVLRGDYAQTYRPGHHNFSEDFLFDPHLEPDLEPELRAELVSRNIRGLAATYGLDQNPVLWIWGLDDTLREPRFTD